VRAQRIVQYQVELLEGRLNVGKQVIFKINYFSSIMIALTLVMHIVACLWLWLGLRTEGSWISNADGGIGEVTLSTQYITAFYWVVATLTTVGYGDVKGFTPDEYVYTMIVEFIGIAFFSFMMGSINSIFINEGDSGDMVEAKLEKVDVWLVKLDNSRMSKSLPKILYDKIKLYIKESLNYDHKKLIEGYELFDQLKPGLRFDLIYELFPKFLNEFHHVFVHQNYTCGKEFMSHFVSQLYCRVFIANQTMVKRGEHFSELYMIFQGQVTISYSQKDVNEYFSLYSSTYFGDYQILHELKSNLVFKTH